MVVLFTEGAKHILLAADVNYKSRNTSFAS